MLLGQYRFILDDDHQLVFPKAFRASFEAGAYATRGFEQNLLIMSEKEFQEIYQRVAGLNIADPLVRLLNRQILGNAVKLEMGAAGRVRIPQDLLSFSGVEKEIVLVGQGLYCEAWAPANWEKQCLVLLDTAANSARFAQLNLAM
jgi:MraZ protein